jgi:chaperonin GroEL
MYLTPFNSTLILQYYMKLELTTTKEQLINGVTLVTNAVSKTYGPNGTNVLIGKTFTKDGIAIAEKVSSTNIERIGVNLAISCCKKTRDLVGDGTTTTLILLNALVRDGLKKLQAVNNISKFVEGLEAGKSETIKLLRSNRIFCNAATLQKIAFIASNSDSELAKLIYKGLTLAKSGTLRLEKSYTTDSYIITDVATTFDETGYCSSTFCTNKVEMVSELENPIIFLYDGILERKETIIPIMEYCLEHSRSLFIVAEKISGEALNILATNHSQGILNICPCRNPGLFDDKLNLLKDLSALTGAEILSNSRKYKHPSQLGTVESSITSRTNFSLILSKEVENSEAVKIYLNTLKSQMELTSIDFEKEKLNKRLARFTNNRVIIHIGADSEAALLERIARAEDTLQALRAAISQGIIYGGITKLYQISKELDSKIIATDYDFTLGLAVIQNALKQPLSSICANCKINPTFVFTKLDETLDKIFNAKLNTFESVENTSIVDSYKVLTVAIKNAVSTAKLILTSEVCIYDNLNTKEHKD